MSGKALDARKIYQVTRFCCRSGMCLTCRAVGNERMRKRIVHADRLDEATADRMVAGWAGFDPLKSIMPEHSTK